MQSDLLNTNLLYWNIVICNWNNVAQFSILTTTTYCHTHLHNINNQQQNWIQRQPENSVNPPIDFACFRAQLKQKKYKKTFGVITTPTQRATERISANQNTKNSNFNARISIDCRPVWYVQLFPVNQENWAQT